MSIDPYELGCEICKSPSHFPARLEKEVGCTNDANILGSNVQFCFVPHKSDGPSTEGGVGQGGYMVGAKQFPMNVSQTTLPHNPVQS